MALLIVILFLSAHLFSGLSNIALLKQRKQLDEEYYARVNEIIKENAALRAQLTTYTTITGGVVTSRIP
jgi:hypothetical protein